ncbi:MAG: E3 binding domain-containing protein [Solirubrobacterales bacterium]
MRIRDGVFSALWGCAVTAGAGFASAKAAELAGALGLDAEQITGTGRDGAVTIEDVRRAGPEPAPDDLGPAGRHLWDGITGEYQLRADEAAQLLAACRLADEAARMEAALDGADVVTTGSKGQIRPHPLVAELRAHRLAMGRLLSALGLVDPPLEGEGEIAGSVAGRKLARARWDRRAA